MNGTQTTPPAVPPKTSPLAIWSLVLGILSLTCFYILAAIPAVICGHVARSRIKHSAGTLTGDGLALAGMITGYIGVALSVVVLPMMLAIAIPNFVRARNTAQMNACNNRLRQIDGAKQQWALENKKADTETPSKDDLNRYLFHGEFPICPGGGTYTINPVNRDPTCSIPKHCLPTP